MFTSYKLEFARETVLCTISNMFPFAHIAYYKTQIAHKTALSILHKPLKSCRYAFSSDIQSFYPSGLCQSLYLGNPGKPLNLEYKHLIPHLIHYQYTQSVYHFHNCNMVIRCHQRVFILFFHPVPTHRFTQICQCFYRHFFIKLVHHYVFPHLLIVEYLYR